MFYGRADRPLSLAFTVTCSTLWSLAPLSDLCLCTWFQEAAQWLGKTFALPVKMCCFNTQWLSFQVKGKILIPCAPKQPPEDKWEFALSKAWIVKTDRLGKARGAFQKKSMTKALAVKLSVPSSKRPQPGTRARYAHLLHSSVPGMSSWATGTLRQAALLQHRAKHRPPPVSWGHLLNQFIPQSSRMEVRLSF